MTGRSRVGSAREARARARPEGSRPEPFVEVTEHHRGNRMAPRDRDQPARLVPPLAQAQAEMRCDEPECAARRGDLDLDGAARLALRHGEVVNFRGAQWPAAYHHLSIVAVGGGVDLASTPCSPAPRAARRRRIGRERASAGIDLCKATTSGWWRSIVPRPASDRRGRRCPAVDVPGHDAGGGAARGVQSVPPLVQDQGLSRRSMRRARRAPPGSRA